MALVNPHGKEKKLKPLLLSPAEVAEEKKRVKELTAVTMSSRETADLIMLGIGGFTPLDGFMGYKDWKGVCDSYQMADGTFWPIPITLSTTKGKADSVKEGQEVLLVDEETEERMGTMVITEKYTIDKEHECKQVYGTTETEHPGVLMVMNQADVNLAGPIKVLSEGTFPEEYPDVYMRPAESRALFEEKGWSTVAAFQTYRLVGADFSRLSVPATILAAEDDPVIPFDDFRTLRGNDRLRVLIERYGGHCGFLQNLRLQVWFEDLVERTIRDGTLEV